MEPFDVIESGVAYNIRVSGRAHGGDLVSLESSYRKNQWKAFVRSIFVEFVLARAISFINICSATYTKLGYPHITVSQR